ncbi:endonuclease [Endothiovibrio diazotrophicus]
MLAKAATSKRLRQVFDTLLAQHGPQHWWPGETPFEIMVGAVLTQNTAWSNVERAIANLVAHGKLDAASILDAPHDELAEWIRPSGYFNVKAKRLKSFCAWYVENGGFEALRQRETAPLREALLAVNGVGPETADDIVLYAFERPVFVIDAYTRRIFTRLGLGAPNEHYEEWRRFFEGHLPPEVAMFNEYHALIVNHGKDFCRPKPRCAECALRRRCTGP